MAVLKKIKNKAEIILDKAGNIKVYEKQKIIKHKSCLFLDKLANFVD